MNLPVSRRIGFFAIFLACAGMMAFALYLQYHEFLNPCPLCIFQRVCVIAVGLIALIAALHNPKSNVGVRLYTVLGLLAAATGFGVAARHAYIQTLPPDQIPACGPGLNYMLQNMPFGAVLKTVLYGSGECAVIEWSLFGISLPGWVAICSLGLFAVIAWVGFGKRRA